MASLIGAIGVALAGAGVGTWFALRDPVAATLAEARAATEAHDWPRAFDAWHAWNESGAGTAGTLLIEAQLALDLGRGRLADELAARVTQLDAADPAAWTLRLNRLRVLDRPDEARALGLDALPRLRTPEARRKVLKATTLATLADLPDTDARDQLDRWIAADPADTAARVARLTRIAANPHPGDPDRSARIDALQGILGARPDDVAARSALIVALGDAGEVDRGRTVLAGWDSPGADPRFHRLQARWDLEYDHHADGAAEHFGRAVHAAPHDWKAHYGLARSLRTLGQLDAAEAEALAVARLRERLDPSTLGPRLTTAFAQLDEGSDTEAATAMTDLAALCRSVGLADLAVAWDGIKPTR